MIRRTEIALVYGAGLVQGLPLVVFPAASDVFTSPSFHGLSSSQYGSLFLPLVVTAIVASTVGGPLARRKGPKLVLLAGLGFDLLSMGILAASQLAVRTPGLAYGSLLFATSALGLGFGSALTALNALAAGYFPERAERGDLAEIVSGGMVAAYMLGFGIGSFGLGPLRDAARIPQSVLYGSSSVLAMALGGMALVLASRRQAVLAAS